MSQLVALRRLPHILALAVCSLAVAAFSAPASARPHHRAGHHAYVHHHKHHHHAHRHHRYRHHRHNHASRLDSTETGFSGGGFVSNIVTEARRYIGGNPTGRSRLWCARFMNMVLKRSGHRGTGSDMASSFAHYGRRVSGPQVGAIAVIGRRGGGHVGVVSGVDRRGNPIIVSGNHGHRVAEAVYPRGRVYAYVMPSN
ncbi:MULTISPECIES: TIGR02594 family protein [unclassified Nitrobacter]|uniref:TIGR02594 family protein n=1 Tax=unclassified Nitrobacter TaxID=2620411 RepID=UPI0009293540|nr:MULTISPECIES: TIGR02594 family protein [unclassified Nitrobacter]MBN9149475.1 TIGR02594 family protein [Nitrobacter sp.]OJV00394.1 MAG: amidase [Nitrobacter sp. 62-23]